MRIYILSMYEEHGVENVKATTNKEDVISMLQSYLSEESPAGGIIDSIRMSEFNRLASALDKNELGMHPLSDGWGGFHLDIVDEWSPK